mmetsp:Transcript_3048/g.10282  ORF Transcript_3048/g.10282 Transcript_3048/m.10282 type:complete len:100 (+) Transcript_3048:1774-2073(+)
MPFLVGKGSATNKNKRSAPFSPTFASAQRLLTAGRSSSAGNADLPESGSEDVGESSRAAQELAQKYPTKQQMDRLLLQRLTLYFQPPWNEESSEIIQIS